MKIGIITIIDENNYGNVLQNYALQRIVREMGNDVDTIDRHLIMSLNSILGIAFFFFKFFYHLIFEHHNDLPLIIRNISFNRFRRNYIKYSRFKVGNNSFPKRYEKIYDCFIFGSDQIWNVYFKVIIHDLDIYFGNFTRREKKIAYAASLGSNRIPDKYVPFVKRSLDDFSAIGVREYEGHDYLSSVLNIASEVVPDPTLMLSAQDWRVLEKRPNFIEDERYVLTYFLGGYNKERHQDVQDFSNAKGLRVYNMNNSIRNCIDKEDKRFFECSPNEFIWLIDNCDYFFTDSFHGSVFALLFCKSFQVFYRKAIEVGNEMESRIKSLLYIFNEIERYGKDTIDYDIISKSLDKSKINVIRTEVVNRGMKFLRSSFENESRENASIIGADVNEQISN